MTSRPRLAPRIASVKVLAFWGLAIVVFSPATFAQAPARRVVVVSSPHKAFQQVADVVRQDLSTRGYRVDLIELPQPDAAQESPETNDLPRATLPSDESSSNPQAGADDYRAAVQQAFGKLKEGNPDLLVTLGANNTLAALQHTITTPIVFSMVPNALDASWMTGPALEPERLTGITTDIEPAEQIEWIHKLHPRCRRLGVFYSERTRRTVEAIQAAARKKDITVVAIEASRDDFLHAIDALNAASCDGALMIADSQVYNLACLKRMLLWGARLHKPVWGFSESLVKAGACGAMYADYERIGRQTASLAVRVAGGEKPATIGLQYPTAPRTAINERTADLIGLAIPRDVLQTADSRFGKEK
jgi:putative ABC transport system substrate-binding protein